MPVVLDLAGVRAIDIRVQTSALSELMAVLHLLAEPDHHLDRRQQLRALTQAAPRELLRELRALSPLWMRFRARHLMPLTAAPAAGLGHELERLRDLPLEAFTALTAEAVHGTRDAGTFGLLETAEGRARFVDRCTSRSESRGSLAMLLVRDPQTVRERLLLALEAADRAFFARMWQQASPELAAAVDDVQGVLGSRSVPEVLTALNPGVRSFPATQQIAFDKLQNAFVPAGGRRYVLVPSVYTSPHVVVKYDEEYPPDLRRLPVVIQFPVAEMGVDADVSMERVRARLTVLSDPSRLDILRHLVNEECTTSELARRTGMTAPQVSRHLRRLREAGLLESVRDGQQIRNRLRLQAVHSVGFDLVAAIVR